MSDYKSEVRDGMRIDWDVPITMDDGLVLRADVFRPVAEGRYPALVSYGPVRQGARVPGGLQDGVGDHGARQSRRGRRHHQQVPELGSGRSGEVGAGRLRLRARGFARRGPLAGLSQPQQRAREPGFPRLHRVGGGAAVVQRQGRPERHFLLRQQPVARGGAAAAAPRGDLRVGRLGGLLPRLGAPRRHRLHLPQELAGHAGEDRAARRAASAAPKSRVTGELVCGPETLSEEELAEEPRRTCGQACSRTRSTARTTGSAPATCRKSRCRCSPPPTGAGRACTRAAISRATCARPRSRNGWKRTAARTGRRSTPTTA